MAEIQFTAYAGDCLVDGRLELPAGRLSDFLNEEQELTLRDVVMQAHEDGRIVEADEVVLGLDEIFAVEARGPRGSAAQRIRTRACRMEIDLAPYNVLGHLHALPGAQPLSAIMRRKPMVPITVATIAFGLAGETRIRDAGTLIVNRNLVRSIRPPAHETTKLELPILAKVDPRAKDYTGMLVV